RNGGIARPNLLELLAPVAALLRVVRAVGGGPGNPHVEYGKSGPMDLRQGHGVEIRLVGGRGEIGRVEDSLHMNHDTPPGNWRAGPLPSGVESYPDRSTFGAGGQRQDGRVAKSPCKKHGKLR